MSRGASSSLTALAAGRGCAIVTIIIHHVDLALSENFVTYASHDTIVALLWYIPMPLFFLCIGNAYARPIAVRRHAFLAQSSLRIAYLYVVWATVYNALFLLVPHAPVDDGLYPALRRIALPIPELWFLADLCLSLAICTALPRKSAPIQIALSLIVGQIAIAQGYHIKSQMAYHFSFLLIGVHYGNRVFALLDNAPVRTLLLSATFYLCVLALIDGHAIVQVPLLPQLMSLSGALAVITACQIFRRSMLVRLFSALGRSAFDLYIVSPMLIVLLVNLLRRSPESPILQHREALPMVAMLIILALCTTLRVWIRRLSFLFAPPRFMASYLSAHLARRERVDFR